MSPAAGRAAAGALTIASRYGDAHVLADNTAGAAAPGPVGTRGEPGRPAFVLALTHGAAGGVAAPDLIAVRDAALVLGAAVVRITQPYRVRGARAPGAAARQDQAWTEVVTALREQLGVRNVPYIQGGRSNGARLACRTAHATGAAAVIALAFPLHPPRHPERSRRGELVGAGVPVAAVSGRGDPFGIPDAADVAYLAVLEGEGHALAKNPAAVGAAVSTWLRQWMSGRR